MKTPEGGEDTRKDRVDEALALLDQMKPWPSEEESRQARIHWATQMLEHQFPEGEEREWQRKQVDAIGIIPWDTCFNWLRARIEGGNHGSND